MKRLYVKHPGYPSLSATTKKSITNNYKQLFMGYELYSGKYSTFQVIASLWHDYFFFFAFPCVPLSGKEKVTLNCASKARAASKVLPLLPCRPLITGVLPLVRSSVIYLSVSCLLQMLRNTFRLQSTSQHLAILLKNST